MSSKCEIVQVATDVKHELEALDLTVEELLEVIRHIGLTINSQTEDHPSWGIGITVASEGVYSLRSVLRDRGWTKEEERGFALAVHPSQKLAINIAKGDDGAGDSSQDVITVSEKGICTEEAIAKNQASFDFEDVCHQDSSPRPTWYLIYNKRGGAIHSELSLPSQLSDTKHISKWRKRVILPAIREDDESGPLTAGFDDGGFEVKLSRKS